MKHLSGQRVRAGPPSSSGGWSATPSHALRFRASSRIVTARAVIQLKPASFIPPQISGVVEPAALEFAALMRRVPVRVPTMAGSPEIATAFVGPTAEELSRYPPDVPAFVLLPGFDSSCMEWRRLYPLLAAAAPTYAVDLVGWGFSDSSLFRAQPSLVLSPADKTAHLAAFLRAVGVAAAAAAGGTAAATAASAASAASAVRAAAGGTAGAAATGSGGGGGGAGAGVQGGVSRQVVVVGASLGGAVAVHFAVAHPELVRSLVLVDAQGFIDGIGPMSSAPRLLLRAGVALLKSQPLRRTVNQLAYHDRARCATSDAVLVSSLHTQLPGWEEANIAFMRSGGFSVSDKIAQVPHEVLVMWGRNDRILDPAFAERFRSTLPYCPRPVAWVEGCGHCPHLEAPQEAARHILEFVGLARGQDAGEEAAQEQRQQRQRDEQRQQQLRSGASVPVTAR